MPSPKGSIRRPARADAAGEPYRSPSLEILQTLEIENTLSAIESRLDSMEIDVARLTGMRDDDQRRLVGEMAVLKARVEDAVAAFTQTAEELRTMFHSLERRVVDAGSAAGAPVRRDELDAGIEGIAAGVGDVLETVTAGLQGSIEALTAQMLEIRAGSDRIAGHVESAAPLGERVLALEQALAGMKGSAARPAWLPKGQESASVRLSPRKGAPRTSGAKPR